MSQLVGIEIGGTKLQLVLGQCGKILERRRLNVEKSRGAAGIREQIERALPDLTRDRKVQRVGVGFGGPVDWRTGKICRSHQIEGWSEFDLAGWLRKFAGSEVFVDNDANVAALGEAVHGAGFELNPVFYVTLGSGVGGGLVVDQKIYHGATPGEAEIGHVRLDREGTTVESRCSGWAMDARIRELAKTHSASALVRLLGSEHGGESRHLAAALQQRDAAAGQLLKEVAEDLAFGLSHVTHLFHPAMIILGGGLAGIGESLRVAVAAALPQFIMDAFSPAPRIALTALGEDAVPMGALELAAKSVATMSFHASH